MFKNAGRKIQVPSLFIYGRNDPFYADESIEEFAETYKASGGDLTFKFYKLGAESQRSQRILVVLVSMGGWCG